MSQHLFQSIQNQIGPYFSKKALKPVGQVLAIEVLGKAIGFTISILLVRELPKSDYAIYTILLTIQGMLIPLSNSTIFIGFKKIGGEIWNDAKKMAQLLKTANTISFYIAGLAFVLVGSYAFFLLKENEAEPGLIYWYLACLLFIVVPEVQSAFLRSALLLQKKVLTVKKSELIGHVSKAIGIVGFLYTVNKKMLVGAIYFAIAISFWLSYTYLAKQGGHLGLVAKSTEKKEYKDILIKYVKLNWHNSLFFAFKGQISIFLLGVFGTSTSLANIGALTRFALIFTIITALFNSIYAPAFSRCQSRVKLTKMYLHTFGFALIICAVLLPLAYFFPWPFLWVLGQGYSGLAFELFLVFVSGSLTFLLGLLYSINLSKAWIRFTPLLEIPTDVLGILIGVFLFDITTLTGVLYLTIFSTFINLILHLANGIYGLKTFPVK